MSNAENTSGRYILTLPLKAELYQEHVLEKRFRLGEQLYNKFLNFEKKKYFEMTKRKDYRNAQSLIKDYTYQIKSLNNASDISKDTKKMIQDFKKQRKEQYDIIYNIKKMFNWSEFGFGMDMKKYRGYYKKNLNSQICNNLAVRCFRAFEKMEEELLLEVEKYMDGLTDLDLVTGDHIGEYFEWEDGLEIYMSWLKECVPVDLSGMKILCDLANGSATSTAVKTLDSLGATVEAISNSPNGININNKCGSTHPEALQRMMREGDYDIGLAFDGDADRLIMVNSDGELCDGDYILYICSRYMKSVNRLNKNMVVTTVMANLGLYKALDANKIDYIQTAVGDKYVFEEMQKNDYYIGGEQSGHIIFLEHEVTGDGLMTALKILEIMKATGKSLQELSEGLFIYPQLLKNVTVKDKNACLESKELQEVVDSVAQDLGDEGRILVRPSGTEPLIRVMVEAKTDELCAEYVKRVTDFLEARIKKNL